MYQPPVAAGGFLLYRIVNISQDPASLLIHPLRLNLVFVFVGLLIILNHTHLLHVNCKKRYI